MSDEKKPQSNQDSRTGGERQPVFLVPLSVSILCGLMIAIHLARSFVLNEDGVQALVVWFAFIPYRLVVSDQIEGGWLPLIWTSVTHAFLHSGWDHLLINTVWLAAFATPVARRYGGNKMVAIFLLSAIAGAMAFAATTLPNLAILIGASGGVAGLTGVAVRFMFQPVVVVRDPDTGAIHVRGRHLARLGELARDRRAQAFIAVWVIANGAVPLLPMLTGSEVGVAWQAHLGGFFTGLLLAPLFERGELMAPLPDDQTP